MTATPDLSRDALADLIAGRNLERTRARALMAQVMVGQVTPSRLGGLLVALRAKGETVDEITGFAEAMRDGALSVRVMYLLNFHAPRPR